MGKGTFRANSPVVNDGIGMFLPTTETSFPIGNGVTGCSTMIHPLINEPGKQYLTAYQTTVHKALGEDRVVDLPGHHFTSAHLRQYKDLNETRDHIVQEEVLQAYDFTLLD